MGKRGGKGGGGGGSGGGGGKGGKGPKPQFTRVIPKFLQQYETMLTGPKPDRGEGRDDEVFTGGGELLVNSGLEGGGGSSSSGMPGRAGRRSISESVGGGVESNSGAGGGNGGVGGGGAFDDYDEEEVAALEAYMKTHPSKAADREALRKRAKELSASIAMGKEVAGNTAEPNRGKEDSRGSKSLLGSTGRDTSVSAPVHSEPERVYTDASGRLKFRKRSPAVAAEAGRSGVEKEEGTREKKKARRKKLAKLNNTKLLSFGEGDIV